VLWLNEAVKGPITANGKEFEESKVYQQHRAKVSGTVRVPHHSAETFGADMEQLLKGRMTFEEGIASQNFRLMAKQRLKHSNISLCIRRQTGSPRKSRPAGARLPGKATPRRPRPSGW
jgi:hypothetical protein